MLTGDRGTPSCENSKYSLDQTSTTVAYLLNHTSRLLKRSWLTGVVSLAEMGLNLDSTTTFQTKAQVLVEDACYHLGPPLQVKGDDPYVATSTDEAIVSSLKFRPYAWSRYRLKSTPVVPWIVTASVLHGVRDVFSQAHVHST